ncbi:hypothetical protein HNQ50_004349 [Silvimonas terrae]|uniref:Uncharacterized protein n=1 Tax=Silvimonas terrae TaxID=300266 RepID=A0A840RNE3_9NEIS|nr:hypothetical protein [Silvimonas terrae]
MHTTSSFPRRRESSRPPKVAFAKKNHPVARMEAIRPEIRGWRHWFILLSGVSALRRRFERHLIPGVPGPRHFLLPRQKKVTKEKATPATAPCGFPALLAKSGWLQGTRYAQTPLRRNPGLRCDARRCRRGGKSTATSKTASIPQRLQLPLALVGLGSAAIKKRQPKLPFFHQPPPANYLAGAAPPTISSTSHLPPLTV